MDSEDSDNQYDEIDRHDIALDDVIDDHKTNLARSCNEEVLCVASSDEDDDHDEDHGDDSSDFDSDDKEEQDIDKLLPSSDKWGKKRKSFYNTSYVDGDWGGMADRELELAEMEEQDAISRQRKLDVVFTYAPQDFQKQKFRRDAVAYSYLLKKRFLSQASELDAKNISLRKLNDEYKYERSVLIDEIQWIYDVIKKHDLTKDSLVTHQVRLVNNIYSRYLMNVLYLVNHLENKTINDGFKKNLIDAVLKHIVDMREDMIDARNYWETNKSALSRLRYSLANGKNITDQKITYPLSWMIREGESDAVYKEELSSQNSPLNESAGNEDGTQKRSITSQIEKNKGVDQKRKKGTQHSRIKKRKQFGMAIRRRNSQIPKVRDQSAPYYGESRGIRASTVRSVKLNA